MSDVTYKVQRRIPREDDKTPPVFKQVWRITGSMEEYSDKEAAEKALKEGEK